MKKKFFILTPSLINSDLWIAASPARRSVIITLLSEANHEDQVLDGVLIPRGAFKTSTRKLAILSGISHRGLRLQIDALIDAQFCAQTCAHQYTIISINNYNNLQENTYEGAPTCAHSPAHTGVSISAQGVRIQPHSPYSNNHKPLNHKNILDLINDKELISRYRKDFPWDKRHILKQGLLIGFKGASEADIGKFFEVVYPQQYTGKAD